VSWHVKQLRSEPCVSVFWQQNDFQFPSLLHLVYLHAHSQEVGDCDYLNVVALHVHLLYFLNTEVGHISHEPLVESSIGLQVASRHKPKVHDDVVCVFLVAKNFLEVSLAVLGVHRVQLLYCVKEGLVKIFYHDLFVAEVHEFLEGGLCTRLEVLELRALLVVDEVLEELEEEGSVEAVTISP